jgi:hypothetical protein
MPFRIIHWSDFKGKQNSPDAANTACGTEVDQHCKGNVCHFNCFTVFDPDSSYMIVNSKYLLNHEQQHLNISELFTRKLRKEIQKYQGMDSSVWKQVCILSDKNSDECEKIQQLYDKETNHSINKEAQSRWNLWIQEQLKK